MTKSGVLAICRLVKLLKCIPYTFHRRALIVATYLILIVNHYELALLSQLEYSCDKMQESPQKGYSERNSENAGKFFCGFLFNHYINYNMEPWFHSGYIQR